MPVSPMSFFTTLTVLLFAWVSSSEARPSPRLSLPLSTRAGAVNMSSYTVPLFNGETALPSPTANLTLKAITLGRGTQNYTCAPGSTGAPAAVGAIAELLDASALLPLLPPRRGMQILNLLPSYLVSLSSAAVGNASIPIIGRHYFDATGVPTFDLGSTGLLRGGVAASIPAPANASRGPDNQGVGAVTWLDLADVGGSRGLSQGYRVETAGGRQPVSCSGQPEDIEVQYAAQYWFYG